jgi:hypothetical protein
MHVASARTGSRTVAAFVIALALSSGGFAGDVYYNRSRRTVGYTSSPTPGPPRNS